MKPFACILATIIYSLSVMAYLFYQADSDIAYGTRKIMFYIPTVAILLFYKYIGNDTCRYKDICFYSPISAFIIIILNFTGVIVDTYSLMYGFFGLIIAVSTMVLIAGNRHGYFKNE